MRKYLYIVLFLSGIKLSAGGGWVEQEGNGYFKLGQYSIIADHYFSPEGTVIPITTVSYYSTSFYSEYGISEKITGIVYVPLFVRVTVNKVKYRQSGNIIEGDKVNNIGDPIIGLKYGIIRNKTVVLSGSLLFGLPFGEDAGGKSKILQTGDGELNQLFKLEASTSLPFGVYSTLIVGFNNRSKNFSDEFHYGGELGGTYKRFFVALKMYGVESLRNGNPTGSAGNGIFSNNLEYLSITPEIAYFIKDNFGVSTSVGFAAKGERILAAPAFEFGVFLLKR